MAIDERIKDNIEEVLNKFKDMPNTLKYAVDNSCLMYMVSEEDTGKRYAVIDFETQTPRDFEMYKKIATQSYYSMLSHQKYRD